MDIEEIKNYANLLMVALNPSALTFELSVAANRGDALCVIEDDGPSKLTTLGARVIDPHSLNTDMAQEWFSSCINLHGSDCRTIWNEDLKGIRLIDVDTRKTVNYLEFNFGNSPTGRLCRSSTPTKQSPKEMPSISKCALKTSQSPAQHSLILEAAISTSPRVPAAQNDGYLFLEAIMMQFIPNFKGPVCSIRVSGKDEFIPRGYPRRCLWAQNYQY